MSAFVCDRNHIQYLVAAARSHGGSGPVRWFKESVWFDAISDHDAIRLGTLLWEENVKSVMGRYPDDTRDTLPGSIQDRDTMYFFDESDLRPVWDNFDPIQVLKACNCYLYQSCEHEGWDDSEMHAFIQYMKGEYVTRLRGYDAAVWGAPKPMERIKESLAGGCVQILE